MLQKNPENTGQEELFCSRLENIIDMRHELVKLSQVIDWNALERDLSGYYCMDNGRPGCSIRLMSGLLFLKDAKGLSDEEVCKVWRENPYFQYFCGEEFFQHRFPCEPPSLSIFRKRIGEEGVERLLKETINAGLRTGTVSKRDIKYVNVDTTVQEKAVKFPTDARLCHKAREELVKAAKKWDVPLRQSYTRKSKEALFMANKYMRAKQAKRARKEIRKVKNYLGRVMRDIERALSANPALEQAFEDDLAKAHVIYNQTFNPKMKEKLYSWHAPEIECIGKGKAHKKYEFGCKASYVTTSKNNFIVGAMALHGNPHDSKTLAKALAQVKKLTGITPKESHQDRGYRGHGIKSKDTELIISGQKRGITPAKRKRQKRRNAIEPIIGHCKNDRKVGARNWLKGKIGDQINAIAMAIGFNLRKILKAIFLWLFQKLFALFNSLFPSPQITLF